MLKCNFCPSTSTGTSTFRCLYETNSGFLRPFTRLDLRIRGRLLQSYSNNHLYDPFDDIRLKKRARKEEKRGDINEEIGDGEDIKIDRETLSSLLRRVTCLDAKLFSKLAFLCNMAYVIPDIKEDDLRRYYGFEFVTSSLENKSKSSHNSDSYQWFVCDDPTTYTRHFIIQGSDSVASWQANLFSEPTTFEATEMLVHGAIYEAAQGLYRQFTIEIEQHLTNHGDRAKLRFTGHSLGGSVALVVSLMLLTRRVISKSALLPVVTFGSPFVFCGARGILDRLDLDDEHVCSVVMHRDIVPRAFSCEYPDYLVRVIRGVNGFFRFYPFVGRNGSAFALCIMAVMQRLVSSFQGHSRLHDRTVTKVSYSPMGKVFILQPHENSSPPHPLLPPGTGLYALDNSDFPLSEIALSAFLNSPHPIEILSDVRTAYGLEGIIIRDHDSSNYLKAMNEVIRQHTRFVVRKSRKEGNHMWPLLSSRSPHASR